MAQKLMDNDSFVKALALGVALVIGVFMVSNIDSLVKVTETIFEGTPEIGASSTRLFTDEEWQAKQKEFAGFWFYESPSLSDRIELQDNGIIWRHTTYRYQFPFGYQDSLQRVSTSYLQPYTQDTLTKEVANVVRVVRETWHSDDIDTCFWKKKYDVQWDSEPTPQENTFRLNGRVYHRYTGDIRNFFNKGALDIDTYVFEKFNVVDACLSENNQRAWIRDRIGHSFAGDTIDFGMLTSVHYDMTKNYYVPICLSDAATSVKEGEEFDVDLFMQLDKNGLVDSVHVISKKMTSKFAIQNMVDEIKEWRFPADGETPLSIKYKGAVIKKSLSY